jgi:hypothetical protein
MKHVAGIRGFVAGALVASVIGVGGLAVVKATGGSSSASLFVAVTPVRVVDTRSDLGLDSVVSGTEQDVMIVGSVVPVGATAVALTVTAVDASAKGFMVVRAGDATGKPSTSNLNVAAGGTVASAVTVKLPTVGSGAGAIKVLFDAYGSSTATTELLIDITGYYEVASVGSGSSGSVGAQGPQGERGPQGEQGLQGIQGQRGIQGLQGIQGIKGDKGDAGDGSSLGAQGPQGDMGPQGVPGADGPPGPQGDQGVPGEAGSDGALAGLTCLDQQFIAQFNGTWQCAELGKPVNGVLSGTASSPSPASSLSDWANYGGSFYGLYGNVPCSISYCGLIVPGVMDHNTCTVSGAVGSQLFITTSPGVDIYGVGVVISFSDAVGNDLDMFPPSTPVSIQVSCGQGIVPANNITPV